MTCMSIGFEVAEGYKANTQNIGYNSIVMS